MIGQIEQRWHIPAEIPPHTVQAVICPDLESHEALATWDGTQWQSGDPDYDGIGPELFWFPVQIPDLPAVAEIRLDDPRPRARRAVHGPAEVAHAMKLTRRMSEEMAAGKLLSLELTGAWLNECRELDKAVLGADTIDNVIARMTLLREDHDPEGWPAVQMSDITALCDEIARLRDEIRCIEQHPYF